MERGLQDRLISDGLQIYLPDADDKAMEGSL